MHETKPVESGDNLYFRWLLAASLLGGVVGWLVQGWLADDVVYWALPALFIAAALFTLNGDNLIEALLLVIIVLTPLALILGTTEVLTARIGMGTVPASYLALAIAKLMFALAKAGLLGNRRFS